MTATVPAASASAAASHAAHECRALPLQSIHRPGPDADNAWRVPYCPPPWAIRCRSPAHCANNIAITNSRVRTMCAGLALGRVLGIERIREFIWPLQERHRSAGNTVPSDHLSWYCRMHRKRERQYRRQTQFGRLPVMSGPSFSNVNRTDAQLGRIASIPFLQ